MLGVMSPTSLARIARATATMRLSVPDGFAAVASGAAAVENPVRLPAGAAGDQVERS